MILAAALLAAAQSCAQWTTDLAEWTQTLSAAKPILFVAPDVRLIEADGAAPEAGFVITVRPRQPVMLQGQAVATPAELASKLKESRDLSARLRAAAPEIAERVPLLAIDREATWSEVVAAWRALADAGYESVGFLFSKQMPATPSEPSKLDAKISALSTLDPATRASKLAELTASTYAKCPDAVGVFERISQPGFDPGIKPKVLAEDLPPAIAKCGCNVDRASVRAIFVALMGTSGPAPTAIVLPVGGAEIERPAAQPWRDAHEVIFAAKGKPVRLR